MHSTPSPAPFSFTVSQPGTLYEVCDGNGRPIAHAYHGAPAGAEATARQIVAALNGTPAAPSPSGDVLGALRDALDALETLATASNGNPALAARYEREVREIAGAMVPKLRAALANAGNVSTVEPVAESYTVAEKGFKTREGTHAHAVFSLVGDDDEAPRPCDAYGRTRKEAEAMARAIAAALNGAAAPSVPVNGELLGALRAALPSLEQDVTRAETVFRAASRDTSADTRAQFDDMHRAQVALSDARAAIERAERAPVGVSLFVAIETTRAGATSYSVRYVGPVNHWANGRDVAVSLTLADAEAIAAALNGVPSTLTPEQAAGPEAVELLRQASGFLATLAGVAPEPMTALLAKVDSAKATPAT